MSFIIPPEAIPGRLSLVLTLFLCMINTLNSVTTDSPKANSSSTALVKWVIICLIFLLLAILEYSWVLTASMRAKKRRVSCVTMTKMTKKFKPFDLDRVMVLVYPVLFILTAVVFWCVVWDLYMFLIWIKINYSKNILWTFKVLHKLHRLPLRQGCF